MTVKLQKVRQRSFPNFPSKSKLISELKIAPPPFHWLDS